MCSSDLIDGSEEPIESNASLEKLQEVVGGHIEHLQCGHEGYSTGHMYINEEGYLYHLPKNKKATELSGMCIVGDVIYFTEEEWNKER